MSSLLIVGAGGHGKVVAEAAELMGKWERIAFLDPGKAGQVLGKPIFQDNEILHDFANIFVAIGDNKKRLEKLIEYEKMGLIIPIIIHPSSKISKYVNIAEGTVVLTGVNINPGAEIGKGCIINTGSNIDHDVKLGEGVHISPGATIAGSVEIGRKTWIGAGATVINNIKIGNNVIIGAGAVVISNIPDNSKWVGVPARRLE